MIPEETVERIAGRAACPRCGQPQVGVLSPERDAWPLKSVCAECGLEIDWQFYFDALHDEPRFLCEHAPRLRWPVAWLWSVVSSILSIPTGAHGGPLWRRIRLEHAVRPWRLVVAVAVLGLMLWIGIVTAVLSELNGNRAWRTLVQWQSGRNPRITSPSPPTIWIVIQEARGLGYGPGVDQETAPKWLIAEATFRPPTDLDRWLALLPLVVAPWSDRGLAVRVPAELTGKMFEPGVAQFRAHAQWDLESTGGAGPRILADGTIEQLSFPLAVMRPYSYQSPRERWSVWWQESWYPIFFCLLHAIGSVLAFTLLPIARRRAKVRWAHALRVGAYGVLGPLVVIAFAATVMGYLPLRSPASEAVFGSLLGNRSEFLLLVAAVSFLWTWGAVSRYLRMERGWAVAASITAIATLMAMVSTVWEVAG
jgi:hypothetical protein